jgi:hypothetical protein
MLTGELVKPRMRRREGRLIIQRLDPKTERWQQTAADLIALVRSCSGQPQRVWVQVLEEYEGDRTDYTVIRGLAKVLTDAATFTPLETTIEPEDLRARLFAAGPAFGAPDLFHQRTRGDLLAEAAADLGTSIDTLETLLYADRTAAYLMTDPGPEWTPDALITRYNLELARAALYWSDQMQVHIYDTFKDFWRYLKLFKLMFWATPVEGGYRVDLDGPISPFVRSTTRYGRQFAGFLPALLLCDRWQMAATVRPPQFGERLRYELDDSAPLTSHFRRSGDFDSQMEADFAAEFHAKFGDERGKWLLSREDEVLLLGDTVMIPDFAFTHKADGRRALVEIVGFWHPNYLRRKLEKVRAAGRDDLILLVYEGVNLTPDALENVPAQVLYFKNKPVLKDVLAMVEQVAR